MWSRAGWMLSSQKHIEEHAESVDIRCGGGRAACYLLGCGIFGCECRSPFPREQGRRSFLSFTLQQLGNAKIQKLHMAVFVDQHIRRLDVAMHDEVRVRVRHRGQHIKEEMNPGSKVELSFVTVVVDRLAFHIFEDKVRLSSSRYTCVQQFRDVGIGKPGKDCTFSLESLLAAPPDQANA